MEHGGYRVNDKKLKKSEKRSLGWKEMAALPDTAELLDLEDENLGYCNGLIG